MDFKEYEWDMTGIFVGCEWYLTDKHANYGELLDFELLVSSNLLTVCKLEAMAHLAQCFTNYRRVVRISYGLSVFLVNNMGS